MKDEDRAYTETIRRVWEHGAHWYTQVAPDPDGCPGITEISRWDHEGGQYKKTAYFLVHSEELRRLIDVLTERLAEARAEENSEP